MPEFQITELGEQHLAKMREAIYANDEKLDARWPEFIVLAIIEHEGSLERLLKNAAPENAAMIRREARQLFEAGYIEHVQTNN